MRRSVKTTKHKNITSRAKLLGEVGKTHGSERRPKHATLQGGWVGNQDLLHSFLRGFTRLSVLLHG